VAVNPETREKHHKKKKHHKHHRREVYDEIENDPEILKLQKQVQDLKEGKSIAATSVR
jgi:hypothetical protein